jgi:hypothetical protein
MPHFLIDVAACKATERTLSTSDGEDRVLRERLESCTMKDSDGLSNRFNSYQQSGSYVPPGKTFAEQQTHVLSETVKTQYHAEETANAVMTQLHAQRQQIQGANDNVWDMRQATEQTKKELRDLQAKYRAKKLRLYFWIALLGTVDFLLFVRLLKCRGSFFC